VRRFRRALLAHSQRIPIEIAPLTANDVPRYRALMLHAYAAAADAFTSTPEERAAAPDSWWLSRIADPKGASIAFGAFDAGELVGTVTIEYSEKPKTRHKAHLIGMFVGEAARGKGAGKALLDAALRHAKARADVLMVTLTVTQGNAAAIRLYESVGFKTFGVEPMAISTPTGFKAKVHMWLPLDSTTAQTGTS
jgi:RimJ/RimL family protein N-acetyltransferase